MKPNALITFIGFIIFFFAIACSDLELPESDFEMRDPEEDIDDEPKFYTEEDYDILSEHLDLPSTLDNYEVSSTFFGEENGELLATVGRVLFYDKNLSADGTISCASCHHQELAFSDNVSFSTGVHGNLTNRNSLALGSLASFDEEYGEDKEGTPGLFWDERAPDIISQILTTITDPKEMGADIDQLRKIGQEKSYYQTLFKLLEPPSENANESEDDLAKIFFGLEAFVRSISSKSSKFDKAKERNIDQWGEPENGDWEGLSNAENEGKELFIMHCESCHNKIFDTHPENRIFVGLKNNGLDKIYEDKGAGIVSSLRDQNGKFKVPGLRNIVLTGPYMHDGRFDNLSQVIDHYDQGVQDHENLDHELKDVEGNPKKLNLSNRDKNNLISFLETLTDQEMLEDKKWSDPFKR